MPVTIIRSQPHVVNKSEAAAGSPLSGDEADKPAVALHVQENVRGLVHATGGEPVVLPKGTLYITESSVTFYSPSAQIGMSIDYPSIVLHAIQRIPSTGNSSESCIYTQIDGPAGNLLALNESGPPNESDPEPDGGDNITEIKFMPDDAESLEAIYNAMSECASHCPDPELNQDADSDEGYFGFGEQNTGSEGEFFTSPTDEEQLNEAGREPAIPNDQSRQPHSEDVMEVDKWMDAD